MRNLQDLPTIFILRDGGYALSKKHVSIVHMKHISDVKHVSSMKHVSRK
jgi:hypothetical protein